jgi:phosphotransferase system HPr-like phosphotransfer protein
MLQIEEWVIVAAIVALLTIAVAYLVYFKVSRKLFPQTKDFDSEIKPGQGETVSSIQGKGIIKMVELNTNENCIITITIDGTNHTLLTVGPELRVQEPLKLNEDVLAVREQLDEKFIDNFVIHIQNRGAGILHTKGKIHYEIKKDLATAVKTVFTELR